jgi:anaerobic magnesium-protoporphyrin IX monomethyl ester cyclase
VQVLLLQPRTDHKYGRPKEPPLALAVLAGVIEEAGHQVACLDLEMCSDETLREVMEEFRPGAVGISFTSVGARAARILAARIRDLRPEAVIIGGGYGMSCSPEKMMQGSAFDYGVIGEGELTIVEFLRHLEAGKPMVDVRGLIWRQGAGIVRNAPRAFEPDLDRFPIPAFRHFNIKAYGHVLPVFFTRGCPMRCLYCTVHVTAGRKPRSKTPGRFVSELKHYVQALGVKTFNFADDNFAANRARAEALCDLLIEEDLGITWYLSQGIRADTVDEPLLRKMRQAGCSVVAIGVETVNPRSLKILRRGVSLDQVTTAIEAAKNAGMVVKTFNLIGCPGDTFDDVVKTIRYNIDLGVDIPRYGVLYPFPGSDILEWVKSNGRMNERFDPDEMPKGVIDSVGDVPYETDTMNFHDIYRAHELFKLEAHRQFIRTFLRRRLGRSGKLLHPVLLRATMVRLLETLYQRFLRGRLEVWE